MSALIPHFLGRFATDADCEHYISDTGWVPERSPSGAPTTVLESGLMYHNTTYNSLRYYDGVGWRASKDPYVRNTAQLQAAISVGDADIEVRGSFTLASDATVPSGSTLTFGDGAIITVPAARTLTINGCISASAVQVFAGTGTVALNGEASKDVLPEWFGAVCDGVTDCTSSIRAAVAACAAGGSLLFSCGTSEYILSDVVNVTKELAFHGEATLHWTASCRGFYVTGSGVSFRGLTLVGRQYAVSDADEDGIRTDGADDLLISRCTVRNWGLHAVVVQDAERVRVIDCAVRNAHYAGIVFLSVSNGVIEGNLVDNIVGTTVENAYGIALSFEGADPVCTDIVIGDNVVSNVPGWHGIDGHAGARISVVGNTVYNCYRAISFSEGSGAGGPPVSVAIVGNVCDSGVTDGSASCGILLAGVSAGTKAPGCSIVGNTIRNYGKESDPTGGGGMWLRDTDGLVVIGNTLYRPAPVGIYLLEQNVGFVCSGNHVEDPWSDTVGVGQAVGIYDRNAGNIGSIISNNVYRGALAGKTFILTYSIRCFATSDVQVINNAIDAAMINAKVDYQEIAYAVAITPVAYDGATVVVGTLTGNITVNAPTGASKGMRLTFVFTQDGAGGHAINFDAVFKTSWVPGAGAGAKNSISFVYDGTNWTQTSAAVGL